MGCGGRRLCWLPSGGWREWFVCICCAYTGAGSRYGPGCVAATESGGLCVVVWTFSGSEWAGAGVVSRAAGTDGGGVRGGVAGGLVGGPKRQVWGVSVTAGAAFLFLVAAHWGLVIFSPTLTSAQLARVIAPEVKARDMVAIHGEYEAGSTLGFYLRRNDLHIVEGRSSNLWYGSYFSDAPEIFETRDSIAAKWAGGQRIFLWEDPHDAERPVLRFAGPVYVVAEGGGKRILSNRER